MKMPFSPLEVAQLDDAIAAAVHTAFRDLSSSEPQLVANLVSALPDYVNKISFSGGNKVKAGGVFVHAQPFVTCASFPESSPASVEIGDLLLLRTLVVSGQIKERRALLLQAKKAGGIPATPDNKNQWHLYEQWPRFEYARRSGGLTGKPRHIKEPDMYEAAKYLLIGTKSSAYCCNRLCCIDRLLGPFCRLREVCVHHTAQPTSPELGRYRCFTGELTGFLLGNAGKVFAEPASRTRGWNRVVHDLIDETAKAKTIFMGRAAGQSTKAARGSGVMFLQSAANPAFFMVAAGSELQASSDWVDGVPDVPGRDFVFEGDDGGGVSIIEFVVEQGEQ